MKDCKIKNWFFGDKKYLHWVLVFLVVFGFGLRAYNISDWYVFKADQSRDANYLKEAYEKGPSNLQLLGPKVDIAYLEGDHTSRGLSFRLGPVYYYTQYLNALIFRSIDPWVMVIPDFIASVLAILLFYFFARIYFKEKTGLVLTALFSCCFYLIQYGRFSWNPNQLIFWELLLVIGLYKASFEKDKIKAGWWVWASFLSLTVLAQVHILGALGFPLIALIFWLIYRPKKINLKFWIGGILTVLILFSPMIVSEIKNKGDNTKRFFVIMTREGREMGLKKRVRKTLERQGEFYGIALTSFHQREIKFIEELGMKFFILSTIMLLLTLSRKFWIKKINLKFVVKSNPFLVLIFIWSTVYLILFSKIVDDLNRARYFLVIAPIPFVIVGYWMKTLRNLKKKYFANLIIPVFITFFIFSNLFAVYGWFKSLSENEILDIRSPKMGYHDDLITLRDLKKGIKYMNKEISEDKKICFFAPDYQHKNSLTYLQELYYPDQEIETFNFKTCFGYCDFFMFTHYEKVKNEIPKEFLENFKVVDKQKNGMSIIWKMEYVDDNKCSKLLTESFDEKSEDKDKRFKTWKSLSD